MIDRVMATRTLDDFDWRFVALILAILSAGILSIYSATHAQNASGLPLYVKQMLWVLVGSAAFLGMLAFDYHAIARHANLFYVFALVLLLVVLIAGKSIRGAQRWIPLGPFAFQPAEFAKLALILTLARYYDKRPREGWIQRVVLPGLIMLPGLLLMLKQPDLGSGLSFLSIYVTILLVVGIRSKTLGVLLLCALMLFPFAWEVMWGSLHDYQRERIMTFANPSYDTGGTGYQGLQSRIAIGSGELLGKGLQGGSQNQLKFLPERHTDFIFAVYAEEWGFLGSLALLALFLGLLLLSFEITLRAKDSLGVLLGVGVIAMFGFCLLVNIGMTTGLFPIVGIPLPLMSYGGSSTVATLAALGLLLNIKRRRLTLFY